VFFLSNIVVVHTSCLVSYHQSHTVFIILCAFASTLYIITSSICLFFLGIIECWSTRVFLFSTENQRGNWSRNGNQTTLEISQIAYSQGRGTVGNWSMQKLNLSPLGCSFQIVSSLCIHLILPASYILFLMGKGFFRHFFLCWGFSFCVVFISRVECLYK
jgi:hypothetical protein